MTDFGAYSPDPVDYPDTAHPMASAIERGEHDRGITLCGSGNGIAMVANKHAGIRFALCWNAATAALARRHNDANVCSLPARLISRDEALEITRLFLATPFDGGRHQRRVDKIPLPAPVKTSD